MVFAEIPAAKLKQFAVDAKALDAAMMSALHPEKRYAFAVTLIRTQVAKVLDDLTEMGVRRVQKLHHKGQEALQRYREQQSDQIDALIALLRDVLLVYLGDGSKEARFDGMSLLFGADPQALLDRCEEHGTYAGKNYIPFLPAFYRSQRAVLLSFLEGSVRNHPDLSLRGRAYRRLRRGGEDDVVSTL